MRTSRRLTGSPALPVSGPRRFTKAPRQTAATTSPAAGRPIHSFNQPRAKRTNGNATYVKVFQGGKRVNYKIPGSERVFEAVFLTGRENDPYRLFLEFDPENDWRKDFLKRDNPSPDANATDGS